MLHQVFKGSVHSVREWYACCPLTGSATSGVSSGAWQVGIAAVGQQAHKWSPAGGNPHGSSGPSAGGAYPVAQDESYTKLQGHRGTNTVGIGGLMLPLMAMVQVHSSIKLIRGAQFHRVHRCTGHVGVAMGRVRLVVP
jgi:hypothetical protein